MHTTVFKILGKLVESRERPMATPKGVYVSFERCYGDEIKRYEWSGLK